MSEVEKIQVEKRSPEEGAVRRFLSACVADHLRLWQILPCAKTELEEPALAYFLALPVEKVLAISTEIEEASQEYTRGLFFNWEDEPETVK